MSKENYEQQVDETLNRGKLADPKVTEVVIEEVAWQPITKQVYAKVRVMMADPGASPAWRRPMVFSLGDGGWMLVGLPWVE